MTVHRVRRALAAEGRMWASIGRWVARRPAVPPGAAAFGYSRPVAPILWTFVVLSAIETVALHLLLPWPAVRLVVDVLSVWGLAWMLGLIAAHRVHPHLVGEDGVRLRAAMFTDLAVPWSAVAGVRRRPGLADGSWRQWDGGVLSLPVSGQTNLELTLRETTELAGRPATAVRFHADDPAAMERAVQARVPPGNRKIG